MKKIPMQSDVLLKSCSIKSGLSLSFHLSVTDNNGDDSGECDLKSSYPWPPHPDLVDKVQELKARIIQNYGWKFLADIVMDKDFKASQEQMDAMKLALENIEDEIEVTGVKLIGKSRNGAIISGKFIGHRIETKVYFEDPDHGGDTEEIVSQIANEVYLYAFMDKKNQYEQLD